MPARRSERIRLQREPGNAANSPRSNSLPDNRLHRTRTANGQASAIRGARAATRSSVLPARIANAGRASTVPTRGGRRGTLRGRNISRPPPTRAAPVPIEVGQESTDTDPPRNPAAPEDPPRRFRVVEMVMNFLHGDRPTSSNPTSQNIPLVLRLQRMGTRIPTQGDPLSTARLQKEIAEFSKGSIEGCSVEVVDNNLFHWIASIPGPPETPYEGGHFKLELVFPKDYPFQAPYIAFITRIYHCNIAMSGHICLDILNTQWSPALSVSKLLISIISLMADPNPNDPLEPAIAALYKRNRSQHDEHAREYTQRFAKQ
ncbi:ubiquitin-conjugating enzyme E2 E3 [Drosophila biarmipes]|uniref:ubiquitin-conjugating enzyme E2 E3 n=1 Tax=Drosophila biarmipes TaxID=125945 RepID=UPI0007E67607|nr:ubiquitin-conjugating enzyme E2 E3 [Drosophila biarmipes]